MAEQMNSIPQMQPPKLLPMADSISNTIKPHDDQPSSSSSNSALRGLMKRSSLARSPSSGLVHRYLANAGNLANLLPTGTVLIFQALTPSFSKGGSCHIANKVLTAILVGFFSLVCFLSSFTDSFVSPTTGKLYYGIATLKGLYVFNVGTMDSDDQEVERRDLSKYRVRLIDFVHALVSLFVFLVLAIGDRHVLECFFGESVAAWKSVLLDHLPLGAGALSSFLFMLFPTNRRGIGYADKAANN